MVGAWYWDGDQTLYFRPRTYWRPHTRVRFVGHLDGVQGSPHVYGVHTLSQRFVIGRSLIAVANTQVHHVKIYRDQHLFATWPMSAGRPGDDTPNGTYLTMAKTNPQEMVGPGYDIEAPWSVRFTLGGNFLHDGEREMAGKTPVDMPANLPASTKPTIKQPTPKTVKVPWPLPTLKGK